jgi:2-haloalkanoic acid dehalogenase type II
LPPAARPRYNAAAMKLGDFKVLSFDCYGTLIDWEAGLWAALAPLAARAARPVPRDAALAAFGEREAAEEEAAPTSLYRDVLARVHAALARSWGVAPDAAADRAFAASIGDWPAFPDTLAALTYLKRHFKLVILSNVDNASFAASNKRLGVAFDAIYTAEDIGSYKPDLNNFAYMLENLARLGVTKSEILHTAESMFHDHGPANKVGLASAWIYRRHADQGFGATMPPGDMPKVDFRFDSMADLVKAHQAEARS